MSTSKDSAPSCPAKFHLVDVGSSGGLHARWKKFAPHINNCGFEPNEEEFKKLVPASDCIWINAGLAGTKGKRELYLTRAYQNSSLLKPNQDLLKTLEWGDGHDIIATPLVDCVTLDEALAEHDVQIDFLKIDTQGSELEILGGGIKSLQTAACIELEVEFVELYSEQPRFAEVDQFMRQEGFFLCDLSDTVHVKQRGGIRHGGPKGRLISADALYFREHDRLFGAGESGQIRHHAITAQLMAYLAYGFVDLAVSLAERATTEDLTYQIPKFLQLIFRHESTRNHVGNRFPCAYMISKALKKLGRLLTPNRSALWSPELGNPTWRKYK